MKRVCLPTLFMGSMMAVFWCCTAKSDLVDGIAAVVNGDIITFTDVKNMVSQTEDALRKTYMNDPVLVDKLKDARKDALEQLIERRLIIQQFQARGGKVPDEIVEEDIRSIIDEQYGRDRSVFIKTLEALGLNLETYKERVRDKIIVRYMQQHEVSNEIIISPYKIEKYYTENTEEFKEGEKVKLRMLFIKKGPSPEETDGARSLAQEILIKLSTGSEFASLAVVYSDSPEGKNGGLLGMVNRDALREELRDVAFSLNQGQISKVIETKDGFYILQVEEKKPSKVMTLDEARDMIEQKLIQQEREQLQKRWLQSLKRKAYIRMY
ncbi:MAG: peptidylprolyl isomerase [Verrucomicrobia bacterium]|nr:peptidylprolyl isomerase [Verrucomicrobiota bacterium]